ncbi:MAG: radical SAM family heme chaperone HemW [Anaerolineaceae bacterium]|nr:radical SAM family heme chaperone HemW [Anaerolineaceae bacterium]
MVDQFSLYIHIPFCQKRCYYCDFNTLAGNDGKIEPYVKALKQEIEVLARNLNIQIPVHSIYFGGGTPSHVSEHYISELMDVIRENYDVMDESEITIEANPGTLTEEKLTAYLYCGINRLSLGVQSTNNTELEQLGRIHSYEDVLKNIDAARKVGFENISVDLMFGLPGQTMQSWMDSLQKTSALSVEHLSIYSLTIEEGTPFRTWVNQGKMAVPDDDFMADQFTYAQEWLSVNGYHQYEISNWRRKDAHTDYRSRHNCQYWLNEPYIGFGLAAHSCFNKQRIANTPIMDQYIDAHLNHRVGKIAGLPASITCDVVDKEHEMKETMMLGLRLLEEGVSKTRFIERFDESMEDVFSSEINELIKLGLVIWIDDERLILSERGVLLGNQAFMRFV